MANEPSQTRSGIGRLIDYIQWRTAGKPFTQGAPGYDAWMQAYDGLEADQQDVGLVSIICPVHDPVPEHLEEAIRSALDQTYEQVELVLIDDGSTTETTTAILDRCRDRPGVTVVGHDRSLGIAAALNTGIAAATGDTLVFLDHDDVLALDAVAWLSSAMAEADVAYTDEDQLTPDGDRVQPFMKPAWSPALLLGMNYVNHMTAINKKLVEDLGGFDPQFSGAQDHDLVLRIAESGASVAHIPKVLYHWRQSPASVAHDVEAKPWALEAARSCVAAALDRRNVSATVHDAPGAGPYRFVIQFTGDQRMTRVVLGADELSTASLNELVEDSSEDTIMFVPGQIPPDDAAIRQLAGWLTVDGVAASGPMILDADGRVVEAGWFSHEDGVSPYGAGRDLVPEPFLEVARDSSALGGRFLVVDRERFLAVGGFEDGLTLHEAGVALTLELTSQRGLTCVADTTVRILTDLSHGSPIVVQRPQDAPVHDTFVSPHLGQDGIEIAVVPVNVPARQERVRSRTLRTRPAS